MNYFVFLDRKWTLKYGFRYVFHCFFVLFVLCVCLFVCLFFVCLFFVCLFVAFLLFFSQNGILNPFYPISMCWSTHSKQCACMDRLVSVVLTDQTDRKLDPRQVAGSPIGGWVYHSAGVNYGLVICLLSFPFVSGISKKVCQLGSLSTR